MFSSNWLRKGIEMATEISVIKNTPKAPTQGWMRGFGNLLHKELSAWWDTRRWLVQGALWSGGLNGLLFVALFLMPPMLQTQGEVVEDPMVMGGQIFFALGMMAISVGVIILMQGAVLDEKSSGTAAWILSKPVSRSAFLLSKLIANSLSVLTVMVVLPSVLAYVQFMLASDSVSVPRFLGGMGLLALHTLFYVALTLLLGVLSDNRGVVLGASLGILLGGTLLRSVWPLSLILPWVLPDMAASVFLGNPLPVQILVPILMTFVWTVFFILMGVWRFNRQEL
jgi:ABC-2 type transport system permease protein